MRTTLGASAKPAGAVVVSRPLHAAVCGALLVLVALPAWGCMFEMYEGRTTVDRPASNPSRDRAPAQADPSLPLDEAVTELAGLVVETLPEEARCAIYPPPIDGETISESSQLATELETEAALAARGKARIITRSQLSVVLEEQNLQVGDLTQRDTQVRVGQMLGATHIVTGTMVTLAEERYRWTLQVIDLTDGTVIGGTRQEVRLDDGNGNRQAATSRSRDERVEATRRRGQSRWTPEFFERFFSKAIFDDEEDDPFDWYGDKTGPEPHEIERRLQGIWQVDFERTPFEVRNNIRNMYGQITMHFNRGNRFSAAIAHSGERMPGVYAISEDAEHGPMLEMQYDDGDYEWASVRLHSRDRLDLYFDGTGRLAMTRIE